MRGNGKVSDGSGTAPGGSVAPDVLGLRIVRARQEAALTEKQLANRLGVSLWRVERLQKGEDDPQSHLLEVAEATGKPPEWFLEDVEPRDEDARDDQVGEAHSRGAVRTVARDLGSRLGRLARTRLLHDAHPTAHGEREGPGADFGHEPDGSGQSVSPKHLVAARIARARQEAGLSQKGLATLIGIPLWRIERIEQCDEDPLEHVGAIAAGTAKDERWFTEPVGGAPVALVEDKDGEASDQYVADLRRGANTHEPLDKPSPPPFRRNVVLGAIALLVTSRFFTEVVHILPRAAKLVDIPILVLLAALALTLPRVLEGRRGSPYLGLGVLFMVIGLLAILSNLGRVAPGPTILFLYGFLAPLGVYYAVYRLWPAGHVLSMSRLLVGLAALQFLVVAFIDLPRFLGSRNPDVVSGTFGANAYQLVFFLLLTGGVIAGVYTFERKRLAARLAPLFFVATLATIILAQYRALLFTMAVTVLLIATLLGFIRLRGAIAALLIAVTFALSLSYLSAQFPVLRYSETVGTLVNDPNRYVSKRLGVADAVSNLYTDDPRFILTGTGPGTFSSRAWYTFAQGSVANAALSVKSQRGKGGIRSYKTDVATKYVVPRLQAGTAEAISGSYALTSPFSSYTSLLAEVGIFGFLAMMGVYGAALLHSLRLTIQSIRRRVPQDPLPGLLVGCTVGFFVLLQMAVLENWLEVTRLTFIAWALLAVVTKEFTARHASSSAKGTHVS